MMQASPVSQASAANPAQGVIQRVFNWGANGYTSYGKLWRSGPGGGAGVNGAVTYVGKAHDFTGGASASGAPAYTTVGGYQNQYGTANGNTGTLTPVGTGTAMNNNVVTYAKGHILPKQIGGGGGSSNLFEQNAGQNNSNPWANDENTAASYIQGQGSKYVFYSVALS